MKNKCNMLGRTMFETIAAIAIISMIAAGIYRLTNSVMNRYKMSRIQTQIYTLQKTINDRFMVEGNYNTQTRHGKSIWNILKDEGLLDGDIKDGKHAFGGIISISALRTSDDGEGEASRYRIMFQPNQNGPKGVWTEVCMSLGDMDWLREGGSSLVKQCYGGTCFPGFDSPANAEQGRLYRAGCYCTYQIPADEETLSHCSDGAYIVWDFE